MKQPPLGTALARLDLRESRRQGQMMIFQGYFGLSRKGLGKTLKQRRGLLRQIPRLL
jgi:hypothetical protein